MQIVVDLAVAGGVPASVIARARGLLPRLVIAQQVADLVNQQRRVLFDVCAATQAGCSTAASGASTAMLRSDRSRPESD
jgi:hypothetical protein